MDMSQEVKPTVKRLLPQGWRKFNILSCTDEIKSKSGNNMYKMRFQDDETKYEEDVHFVSEPKKRWFLKNLLDAIGVPNENGIYKFSPPLRDTVIDKSVEGLVTHEPNKYINRDGIEVETTQHKIVELKPTPEIQWDDKL